jgi:DegV family protein with EDD domain
MEIALVTDSTSDIPKELAESHNINVMPNHVIIDGKSLIDGIDITREEFYHQLPTMRSIPTTATSSSGSYQELYQKILDDGAKTILSIHPSGMLSGILNAANSAAQAFEGKIKVIDSKQITLGLGFQVLGAAEAVVQGLSAEQVLQTIESAQKRVKVVAMLDKLEYIRKSGRVSWARASLGSLLSVKPFVEVKEGQVHRLMEVRTRRKGIERLVKLLEDLGPLEHLALLHTNAEADARRILETTAIKSTHPPLVVNVTTVIGSHVGPNCLGFAVVTA